MFPVLMGDWDSILWISVIWVRQPGFSEEYVMIIYWIMSFIMPGF